MTITNKDLKKRIVEISYKYKLSHIGSCITAVDIIDEIFAKKKPDEKFVLSSGHAGLALYVVLEKYEGHDAEKIWEHHGTHPDRCDTCHIDCSSGSLGNGLPIAVGMALADRSKNVYCLISDGETAEGSIWESLSICEEQKIDNLHIYINCNGYGAYRNIAYQKLLNRISAFRSTYPYVNIVLTDSNQLPFLNGLDAHYHVMTEKEYEAACRILS